MVKKRNKQKKQGKHAHVVVCIPSTGTWRAEFGKCLALMTADFGFNQVEGYASQRLSIVGAEGSMLVQQRHLMVKKALQSGATHILFLDSDMTFPRNLARKLLAANKDFVAANCTTRAEPVVPVAHDMDGNRLDSRGKTGLEEVQHVGLAVALIRAEIFKQLRPPLFMMEWVPEMQAYCGEDVYFCHYMQSVTGAKLYIDHDVSQFIGHVGVREYRHGDVTEGYRDF